ncbi:MAG: fibrobacter succinogenes major paralogous domain-containing protein [Fibrobacter sp.]|nr:fibrobacter succinogenes major paralogous domain-containing protein [Fibrobacter sp.]
MCKLSLGLSFVAMAFLVACGDGSGTNADSNLLGNSSNSTSESDDEYDSIVAEVENLPKCTEGKDGEVYYVKKDGVAYTCRYDGEEESGEWVRKKKKPSDDDQELSSSAKKTDISSSSEESEDDSSSSEESSSSSSVSPASSDASIYNATANTLTDLRDGQVYRTTTIDIPSKSYSEVWMAENLNFVTENSWCGGGSGTTEGDCSIYGRLYKWAAAVSKPEDECGYGHECDLGTGDIRGACPKGWHVPSQSEWNELFTAVGGSSTAGTKLKSTSGWDSSGNGTDNFGFSALPAGLRYNDGLYYYEGGLAYFWSSTERNSGSAYYMYLSYGYDDACLLSSLKYHGFSVRCLKD